MDNYEKILEDLRRQRAEQPEMAEMIDLHLALLTAQSQAKVPAPPAADAEACRQRLEQGQPLLRPEASSEAIDWPEFARLFDQLCHISMQHRPDLAHDFQKIRALAGGNSTNGHGQTPSLRTLAGDYLASGHTRQAESLGLDTGLLDFLLNNSLHPFLRAQAAALAPALDDDLWRRGNCPTCGGQPDLALFTGERGARHLLCSRCDTVWAFKRVACPFCGNEDPHKLAYFPGEDGRYRLDVCEACGRYLKTVDRRQARQGVARPVERVLTWGMDLAAEQEGYHR